jgi:stage II sporulation protein GA (sporulation sigma-E factor processing peptidase)
LILGNFLKDPISGENVVIIEKRALEGLIEKSILDDMEKILKGKWIESRDLHNYAFKVIPFMSLGNERGLLVGIKPDLVRIYDEKTYYRDDILIGIYDGKISKNGIYKGLIGLEVLEGENKNEFTKCT